jgi:alkanesulfonate monooxygenase SsuD/methylene tetrahydromethanopterin reductase-like flavin-dependent oxidoreductase (luciferase family)/AcrR family transcriptional regulator
MPMLTLRYDMRSPEIGAPPERLYRAAVEQCAWAEEHLGASVSVSEHHHCDDGYCPSPLVLAAAIAGATRHMLITVAAAVLPLHDPVRLAEDIAVTDLVSGGRLVVVLVAGYRPVEFAMLGRDYDSRGDALAEGVDLMRRAFTGEQFEHQGRSVLVRPRPAQRPHPPLILGASSPAAARRAARHGDGIMPALPSDEIVDAYLAERARLSRPAGIVVRAALPFGVHVTDDPDRAWPIVGPHFLHEARSYAAWEAERPGANPYPGPATWEELRDLGFYAVVTPDECVELWESLDDEAGLLLHPLVGGLDPEIGWESLDLFEREVLPRIRKDDDVPSLQDDGPRSTSRREERRRQQDRLSALHILDAAEEVFDMKGYVGATIRGIADQAEISVGAIYNLFPGGKDEVFTAVIGRRTEEQVEIIDQAAGGHDGPRQRLHALVDAILDYYADHARFYRLFQRAIGGDWLKFEATASDTNWQGYQTILDLYAALFRDGIEAGEMIDDDPAAMAVMFAGILQAYLAHRVVGLGPHSASIDDTFPPERLHALIDRAFSTSEVHS